MKQYEYLREYPQMKIILIKGIAIIQNTVNKLVNKHTSPKFFYPQIYPQRDKSFCRYIFLSFVLGHEVQALATITVACGAEANDCNTELRLCAF